MKFKFNIGDKVIATSPIVLIGSILPSHSKPQIGIVEYVDTTSVKVEIERLGGWYRIDDVKPYIKLSSKAGQIFEDILNEI